MSYAVTEFTPEDLAGAQDPYALLARVREQGDVVLANGRWLVLGYNAATALLSNSKAETGFIAELYRNILPPGAARDEMSHRINFMNEADHNRVRKLIAKAFTPRRINALRPFVRKLSQELLAPLEGEETIDLIQRFTHQVPSLVISELLGVPIEDRDRLTALADRVAGLLGLAGLSPDVLADAVAAAEEMHAYLRALLAERRESPKEDLISALLAAEEDNQRLNESELLSLAATLYSAGHRTTRDLFSNGLSVVLSDDALREGVRQKRFPVNAVVEEFLRYETPTHYVARMLHEPMRLGEVEIPAEQPIAVMLAAANRDPAAYPEPDRFDPARWTHEPPPPQPLSFALGSHYCLGANLARLEAQVMLESLFESFPDLRLAPGPLTWWHSGLFRGLESLPVHLGKYAAPA